ncbi:PTS sugar transporter subunit IIC/EAL domain-containing protein [Pleomorphomonas sp. JP5]|uniref:PTS sugar transporter subunit IIC/EAL domain-containing protein n=1 Tax=Pleomorphomonas sp. JP5 TaxID=2942998 RepID=UPI0020446B85|nr:EAL domain-containing protein [Pleomorphomonas sp. JP5]MCM5559257.1 EAL domain-containing protein [Pleomorphomonas sp. JP5]
MTNEPIADRDSAQSETQPAAPVAATLRDEAFFIHRLSSKLVAAMGRLAAWPLLVALRRALLLSLPMVLVGAFAHFVNALLSFSFVEVLHPEVIDALRALCSTLVDGTFGLVSLVVVAGFSYSLAVLVSTRADRYPVNPASASVVALACFFIVVAPETLERWKDALSSSRGLPAALVVAISASYLFLFLARRPQFRLRLRGFGADPLVGDLFSILPAGMITLLVFAAVRQAQVSLGGADLTTALSSVISAPFAGAEPSAMVAAAYVLVRQSIWFLGGHGGNMLAPVLEQMMASANAASAAGVPTAFTWNFFPIYSAYGGSGSTLCLILALLYADREPAIRRLAWLSLLPAFINVNEPLLFGLPLILNPIYVVPFILIPLVQALIAYAATIGGLAPVADQMVPWTMPALFNGYLATGSPAGVVLQLASLAVGTVLYLPFVRVARRLRTASNAEAMRTLIAASESTEVMHGHRLIDLHGTAGHLAGVLARDLTDALASSDRLFLQYQPQVCIEERRVFGVEALLRWNHETYGFIPPSVTVALADDMHFADQLGEHVLRLACRQRAAWASSVPGDLIVSVNVSPLQLQDASFDRKVLRVLAEEKLDPHLVELEITESTSLAPAAQAIGALLRLRKAGVRIALDDFGMGHTSLHYLRELPLDTLKIDRSLTFTSQGDLNEHVIRSIVTLSRTLGLRAVVEGIEQPEQLPRFIDLGCARFQGYLFSRPLESGPCLDYILANAGIAA